MAEPLDATGLTEQAPRAFVFHLAKEHPTEVI
jgi:hypothetical protein